MTHPSKNLAVLQGVLSSDPRRRTLPSGDDLISYELTTETTTGRATVPVVWFSPSRPPMVVEGDEVLVTGVVRRRFFQVNGTAVSRTEVVADVVTRPGNRTAARALERLRSALDGLADAEGSEPGEGVHP